MQVLSKKHKVKIIIHEGNGTKAFINQDEGEHIETTPAPFAEILSNVDFVALENKKIQRLKSIGKKDGDIFEMTVKYLVE